MNLCHYCIYLNSLMGDLPVIERCDKTSMITGCTDWKCFTRA